MSKNSVVSSSEAHGPALPIGRVLVAVTTSHFGCYQGGGGTEPSQKFTRKMFWPFLENFGSITFTELHSGMGGGWQLNCFKNSPG